MREHIGGEPSQPVVVVHGCGLALLVRQQEVIKHTNRENCAGASRGGRIETSCQELLIVRSGAWTTAEAYWELMDPRHIYNCHQAGSSEQTRGLIRRKKLWLSSKAMTAR